VLAVLFAPPLAMKYGWQAVYGLAAFTMLIPMAVMWFCAKEPPDHDNQTLREHVSCLFEKDGWAFSLIYVITFGGFIGLASFLPTYFYDQFSVTKVQAGQLTMLATLMGSVLRIVGGYISDKVGGINALNGVLILVAATLILCGLSGGSVTVTTLMFMLCFAALGAGNGALFQLVPLRWPLATAVAGSMIGEIGALGGGFIPNAMGQSKQFTGTYLWGFVAFAALSLIMLVMMRFMQGRWTRTWAEKGGRARTSVGSSVPTPASQVAPARGRVSSVRT
jgi:NNP family nitrate/nitrite transporter-like MFS transporter